MMILTTVVPLIPLPLVTAGVHKLKLHRVQTALRDPVLEAAYVTEKYGGPRTPSIGGRGLGHVVRGGHIVPLTGTLCPLHPPE